MKRSSTYAIFASGRLSFGDRAARTTAVVEYAMVVALNCKGAAIGPPAVSDAEIKCSIRLQYNASRLGLPMFNQLKTHRMKTPRGISARRWTTVQCMGQIDLRRRIAAKPPSAPSNNNPPAGSGTALIDTSSNRPPKLSSVPTPLNESK